MSIEQLENDNQYYYAALKEWIAINPQQRAHKRMGDLTTDEWSEILQIAQDFKVNRIEEKNGT